MTHAIWAVCCTVFFAVFTIFFTVFTAMISQGITKLMQIVRRISQQMIIAVIVPPLIITRKVRWKKEDFFAK